MLKNINVLLVCCVALTFVSLEKDTSYCLFEMNSFVSHAFEHTNNTSQTDVRQWLGLQPSKLNLNLNLRRKKYTATTQHAFWLQFHNADKIVNTCLLKRLYSHRNILWCKYVFVWDRQFFFQVKQISPNKTKIGQKNKTVNCTLCSNDGLMDDRISEPICCFLHCSCSCYRFNCSG